MDIPVDPKTYTKGPQRLWVIVPLDRRSKFSSDRFRRVILKVLFENDLVFS